MTDIGRLPGSGVGRPVDQTVRTNPRHPFCESPTIRPQPGDTLLTSDFLPAHTLSVFQGLGLTEILHQHEVSSRAADLCEQKSAAIGRHRDS
jgi:hypothetical protein